jgi:hypothetical protein
MASHFVSLNRGQEGSQLNDFVSGAASSGNVGLELRLDDTAGYRRIDIIKQLKAFEIFFENPMLYSGSGFVVKDSREKG